jgi:hypothetical protein
MEIVLIIIGIVLYIAQFITVLIVVAVDIIDVRDHQHDAFVYYKSKRQILIDLIPGSWILRVARVVGEWYKTLK